LISKNTTYTTVEIELGDGSGFRRSLVRCFYSPEMGALPDREQDDEVLGATGLCAQEAAGEAEA
jgi:hypothetical protein